MAEHAQEQRATQVRDLERKAAACRLHVCRMLRAGGHGHIGGAFSVMDIVTALYFYQMRVRPAEPLWKDRDRFLLSAGHKCLAQYAALAEKGFFAADVLDTYGALHSPLPGHPNMQKLPGIEANTGALGHGLSIGVGMALGLRLDDSPAKVYVVLGDGELAEGSNWEAAAAAAHHRTDNLTAFIDNNGLQISGRVEDVMDFAPIADKFRAFGWAVREIDGNRMEEVVDTLDALPFHTGQPSLIVAHTVKSKGFSEGEGKTAYHYWNPTPEDCDRLEKELRAALERKEAV